VLTVEQPGSATTSASTALSGAARRRNGRGVAWGSRFSGPRRIAFILSVSPSRGRAEPSQHVLPLRVRAIPGFGSSGNIAWRIGL
jgi:hypothetical protein